MNAVIGAGIIGLAYVASVLGYIQFMFWIALVLIISGMFQTKTNLSFTKNEEYVFPMDAVSILSQAEFGPNGHWEDALTFTCGC